MNQRGFALIELIAVIVLVGIIASFSAFFLYTGFQGYLNTKKATEGALNAQMALDRIALEFRDINEIVTTPTPPTSTAVTYKSEVLTGTRILKYEGGKIIIGIGSQDYPLLEGVTSFNLQYNYQNLDPFTPELEVAGINVQFFLNEIGKKFETQILPRYMVR